MSLSYTILVSFNGSNGHGPDGGLIADASGNLFGTTNSGGANNDGTVFEIANTGSGYATTPTVLVSFDGSDGEDPAAGLIADANGDLFGATSQGGGEPENAGTVFEITNTGSGYASTPTVLVDFSSISSLSYGASPNGGLIADANGDLFGTTADSGPNGYGTVFEIPHSTTGYATTPIVLATFDGSNGDTPNGNLIADADGDLFGTTRGGGANGDGTVFEIAKTTSGYASTPTVLASFNGNDDSVPDAGVIIDANGNLIGATQYSGDGLYGSIYEIVKTASGYADTPKVLVNFNNTNGTVPVGDLIANANGDLFGETAFGGADNDGEVFEIVHTENGYANTPTVLFTFNGSNGKTPEGGLTVDASGDLFGTTSGGGADGDGVAFEITNSGFVVCYAAGTRVATPRGERPIERLRRGDLVLAGGVDGEFRPRPVRWIGRRVLNLATHPEPELAAPIRLRAGALGPGRPARDLVVSPDHCLLLDQHLLRAYRLLNGVSVVQEHPPTVEYWHVELDRHALLLAEGVPAESYLDEGTRDFFSRHGGLLPGPLGLRTVAACAPYAPDDEFAERIWRDVAARADAAPPPPEPVAGVDVFADGRKLRPLLAEGDRHLYALPPTTEMLRIVSGTVRPTATKPWLHDRRRLGIGLRRVGLEHGATLPLDGPGFAHGWHSAETGVRWSEGDAVLRLPPGAGMLDLRMAHPS